MSVQTAQFYLFAFLVGIVLGTLLGGPVGDRVGRIPVMWFSILGALPFALMLPLRQPVLDRRAGRARWR